MLVRIDPSNYHIYCKLSQPYEAEFAPTTGAQPNSEGIYPISTQLDDQHHGYLWYYQGVPAGFYVLHDDGTLCTACECYILPEFRKLGLGRSMSFAVYDLYPRTWQSLQLTAATSAHCFGQHVQHEYTSNHYTEELIDDPKWGRCYRQTFESRSKQY